MTTEVKHGLHPKWDAETSGEYWCEIVGHYTSTPGLTAAGVRQFMFQSGRCEKQVAELLGMRTAFLEWFREMYDELTEGRTSESATARDQVMHCVERWR